MAQNDMHVIMYKILCYLYDCMKKDKEPDPEAFSFVSLGIPERYWSDVMHEMFRKHLVSGVIVLPCGPDVRIVMRRPRVTMEGAEFLQENTMMAKARDFLITTKAILPVPGL